MTSPEFRLVQLSYGSPELHAVIKLPAKTEISNVRCFEQQAQQAVAVIGTGIMEYGLNALDTDGEPVRLGPFWWHSKGVHTETYQCTFGPVTVARHLYANLTGGECFIPLENRARIIGLSTPLFASSIAAKYCDSNGRSVQKDLEEHHARKVSLGLIQSLSARVAHQPRNRRHMQPALRGGMETGDGGHAHAL